MQIRKIHACTGHRAALYALAPGRTDRHFLTAGGDGIIVEWDLDDLDIGKQIATVETQVFSLVALRDKQRLVAGNMNGGMHWIDLANPVNTLNVLHHQAGVYALLEVGNHVFSAGNDGLLTRWDTAMGRSLESLHLSNQALRTIAYAPTRNELAIGASDHAIYILDADTLAIRRKIPEAHQNSVFTLAYSPDERLLLSGGRDAMLRVWDVQNDFVRQFEKPAHWFTINHLVYSPDGQYFATASRDKTLKIWDATTFELLKVVDTLRFGGHINSVNRLLWLPDFLISCSDDRTAMVWEVKSEK